MGPLTLQARSRRGVLPPHIYLLLLAGCACVASALADDLVELVGAAGQVVVARAAVAVVVVHPGVAGRLVRRRDRGVGGGGGRASAALVHHLSSPSYEGRTGLGREQGELCCPNFLPAKIYPIPNIFLCQIPCIKKERPALFYFIRTLLQQTHAKARWLPDFLGALSICDQSSALPHMQDTSPIYPSSSAD